MRGVNEDPDSPSVSATRFGTFQGVFRPTLLSILGGQFFLREGWLVGNAGLVGALAVILAAYLITGATVLSLSSIATNTRVKAGGVFAIIAQSLGLEAGGAIGIPLYFAQTLAAVMYIYAFGEVWGYLFPSHDIELVVVVAFVALGLLSWRSASLAFQTQGVMLFAVGLALVSVLLGSFVHPAVEPAWFTGFPEASLSKSFALFFPAATGITVGAAMSGQLDNPRQSIPRGTITAWAITLVVYVAFAIWCAFIADQPTLLGNKLVMVERSLWSPVVLFGVACLNLMAALSCLVAAPQMLRAMAVQGLVPAGAWLVPLDSRGEPSRAVLATIVPCAIGLSSGSLDAIAPLLTSLNIVAYLAINLVVWLEYSLGMISFRPTFAVGPRVPFIGMALCLVALVATSPGGGIVELGLVLAVYIWLSRRKLKTPWETVRSGVAVNMAAWAARRASGLDRSERAWKPDVLTVVDHPEEIDALRPLMEHMAHAHGSIRLVGIGDHPEIEAAIPRAGRALQAAGVYTTWTRLHTTTEFLTGAPVALEALQGSFFPPNLVLVDGMRRREDELQALVDRSVRLGLGVLVTMGIHGPLPERPKVAVWLSDRSPDWNLRLHNANLDLPVLLAYLVSRSAGGDVHLVTVVSETSHESSAVAFLDQLKEMGRLPDATVVQAVAMPFMQAVQHRTDVDLHLFGLARQVQIDRLRAIQKAAGGPCLFTLDSGRESVVA